ncbi:MAG TPA: efflux RND transporter periplasmic adaptor subunit [Deltaproteobacteria bacterium]|nr:efflux RND transporter periplasmic adaptor subunit [Deltaproteobacteria bacterium]
MSRKNATLPYLFFLVSMLPATFPYPSQAGPPGRGKGPPPVVTVMPVTEKEVNLPDEYVGRVEAIQAVDLRARVEGYLEQVKFREGADVRAGDLLYLVEQAPYKAKVGEVRAKVAEAEAALKNARQYLQRLKAVRSGGVSATDVETAVNAELRANAALQEAGANLEQAEINLGYTTIKAPISGRIGRTTLTKGNLVGPGSGALARIVQLHPIRVVYSMSEYNLAGARNARQNRQRRRPGLPSCSHDPDTGRGHVRTPGPGGFRRQRSGPRNRNDRHSCRIQQFRWSPAARTICHGPGKM